MDKEKKRKLFLLLTGGLILLGLLIGGAVLLSNTSSEKRPGELSAHSSQEIPEGELLVSDLYEGKTLIPEFDMPLNEYDTKKFLEKDGFIRYDVPGAMLGVDVSEHQGDINWQAVKDAGMEFAILRLGYRGLTQGLLNVDETFEKNYAGAKEAGLQVGVYFFSQAVTKAEAQAEAQFALDALDGRELSFPVVYDWERPFPGEGMTEEDLRAHGMTGDQVTSFAQAFCEKIKEGGYIPSVYTNKSMAYGFFDLDDLKEYGLWYAEYQKAPSLYYHFDMWQYSETGAVPGIEGGVDLDICFPGT